jgi:hypothetical protein
MYLVGFIKTDAPQVLINPVPYATMQELYDWNSGFLNEKDFKLDVAISRENLEAALQSGKPVRVSFNGHKAALLLGDQQVVHAATERMVYTDFGLSSG